ncbi:MAG: DUF2070 family protein [Candidatus Bathyarchaeia archaeon]|jgi:putative membrane protein
MGDVDSLNHSIDNAKKHYGSMFSLISSRKSLLILAVVCLVIGLLSYAAVPAQGLALSLILALSFFALTVSADLIVSKVLLKADPIFVLRRNLFLSWFSLGVWLIFMIIGVALGFGFGELWWVRLSLLGFAAIVTLRIIVFVATSDAEVWRRGLAVLLQPTLCLIPLLFFWAGLSGAAPVQVLPFIVLSPVIALIVGLLFFYPIVQLGKSISISSIPLFKAFIADWVSGANAPLEKFFEDLGENADIKVDVLKFESTKPKAAIILSHVHPGPFSNIGSSLLPSLMKHEFQKVYACEACTPLGILGHERDLASQAQNHKIISQVVASANFKSSADSASPRVKATEGFATASCQIFGDTAFISFTLAPKTTEDLPQELGRFVSEEAEKYGLKNAIVVNTHNSLTEVVDTEVHLDALRTAASRCLQKAVAQPRSRFKVGAASVYPQEFSLKDGMGSGGITAIAVEVQGQKTVYVVIDGNNMISGLREKVLAALASAGFGEGEVFTTDTHAVSAIITGRRGYHPVGEVMDNEVLIRYICDAAKKADATSEASSVGSLSLVVPNVRVIGEARLKSLTSLVDRAIQKVKQTLVPIFGLEGLILILILLLL